jgi:glyoxylase-like metal-dependent hydrolase (beta-lactamase superfamily II)
MSAGLIALFGVTFASLAQSLHPLVHQAGPGVFYRQSEDEKRIIATTSWIDFHDFVVIDANFPWGARAILTDLKQTTQKPVRFVSKTHYHGDHSFGNGIFAEQGATIIASDETAADSRTRNTQSWQKNTDAGVFKLSQYPLIHPQLTFHDNLTLDDGEHHLEFIRLGPAHTRGDVVAWLPKERILFTGDLCTTRAQNNLTDPGMDPQGWVQALGRMYDMDPAVVVPGHGLQGTKDVLKGQQAFLSALIESVQADLARGATVEQILAGFDASKYKPWSDDEKRNRAAVTALYDRLKGGGHECTISPRQLTFGKKKKEISLRNHAAAYPRPQLERNEWICLNGVWDFSIDQEAIWTHPRSVEWNARITVPFSPETSASGINECGFFRAVWYRRTFDAPQLKDNHRLRVHFGAVDYCATVWVNGTEVAFHQGGYTPFEVDITDVLRETGPQTIVVRAEDDPLDLAKPRGKQDWKQEPHSIWYPRTTGIWQTVWLETVPQSFIQSLRWTSNLQHWEIGIEAHIGGVHSDGLELAVRLEARRTLLSDDKYSVVAGEVHRQVALSDPGIDDFRNELLWSPESPTIVEAHLELRDSEGHVIDRVHSYSALRSISLEGDRFILNGRPLHLRLVLDQGYWPGTGLTAPDDEAFVRDINLVKKLGFNGVRKHQKIENPRFLYWADRIGLLVWEEMPSAYRYTRTSIERLTREWVQVLNRDSSHPCIVAWVPFNESWGVPDLPNSVAQRHYVQALYHLTKTLDPTRPVIGNDGWESVATDIIGIHDYDANPDRILDRYKLSEIEARLFKRERPGGRMLFVDGQVTRDQPIILTEFGGIALSRNSHKAWGYSEAESADDFLDRYEKLLQAIKSLQALAGFCYTQFTDTYQEANGLLYADRTPKAPIEAIASATKGSEAEKQASEDPAWRDRIMREQH